MALHFRRTIWRGDIGMVTLLLMSGYTKLLHAQQTTSIPNATTTEDSRYAMLWDIFPEVYDMSQLPEEFTIILGVGIGIVLLIVLTLGIGCFCLEKKRRDNAMKLAAYLEEHRNEKFSQMELQERSTAEAKIQRQITTVLYADDEDDIEFKIK